MINETKRNIFEEVYVTEVEYLFTIKPVFVTIGSIKEISRQKPLNSFTPEDSIRDLLGVNGGTKYEEYILSDNPVECYSSILFSSKLI